MPLVFHSRGIAGVGYSNDFPGGYGELMVLTRSLLLPVPDGLPTELAALTEPMAVGAHAVAKGAPAEGRRALVVGCGPVGLAVIAALRLRGIGPSWPPISRPSGARWPRQWAPTWSSTRRRSEPAPGLAESRRRGAAACSSSASGVPGMIGYLMRDAPRGARIVVAGVCMELDRIRPMHGINKELSLQFVLGYTPDEFAGTLRALADGKSRGAAS